MDVQSTDPFALVVDDDALIRMDAAEILREAGFRPLEAADVDSALRLIDEYGPALTVLFTDVEMPGRLDGFALAQIAADRLPEIAVIVASGRVTPRSGDLPEGAAFIGKPFSAEVVKSHLADMLPEGRKPEPLKTAR